jgi:hypothetical protein
MLIAFVHNGNAFLPGLHGYINFFSNKNIEVITCSSAELPNIKKDVEWHFLGLDTTSKNSAVKIHEYTSASTPPFSSIKNKLKVQLNSKPDFRLFLNEFTYNSFHFNDDVPFGFRDIGIHSPEPAIFSESKQFDFIYVGEMKGRRLNRLLSCFTTGRLASKTILFLTKDYKRIAESVKQFRNIHFLGPVLADEVNRYIQSSRFGINFIPDIPPFNQQTSTKLLEYAANKVPIITTKYQWVVDFENKYGGNYFYLNNDLSNFTWDDVTAYKYSFPNLSEWTWDFQIKKSGVLKFLASKFPSVQW